MLWIHAEDSYYYDNPKELDNFIEKKSSEAKNYKKVHVFNQNDLDDVLKKGDYKVVIISPYAPSHFNQDTSFFGVIKVPNRYGLLTTSEKEAGITEYEKLHNATGLTIEESPLSFDDMAGNERLREIAQKLNVKYSMGEVPKAVFLAGVPGTGKSFFAQCLAGETKRFLVSFNLAKLMYNDNPIEAFDNIVEFLLKQDGKYLFWIDEVEKMLTESEKSEHLKNKFLTFLNDLGVTIDIDAFVVLTANNVSGILEKNPELIRGGRVETYARIFMDFPKIKTATSVASLYINKRNSLKQKIERVANLLESIDKGLADENIFIYRYVKDIYDILKNKGFNKFNNTEKVKSILEKNKNSNVIKRCFEAMEFPLKGDYITDYIERNYVSVCRPTEKPDNFPYVQAEIKEIITQLYYKHLEVNLKDNKNITEIMDQLMKDNIPIGQAGVLGINKMKGNQNKFSIVLD